MIPQILTVHLEADYEGETPVIKLAKMVTLCKFTEMEEEGKQLANLLYNVLPGNTFTKFYWELNAIINAGPR